MTTIYTRNDIATLREVGACDVALRELRDEARQAGDSLMVETCTDALAGNDVARSRATYAIIEALGRSDDGDVLASFAPRVR